MTANALAERTMRPRRFVRLDRWLTNSSPPQFSKSVGEFLSTIYNGLPEGELTIKEIVIRGNKVEVRYNSPAFIGEEFNSSLSACTTSISSLNVLNLANGQILERYHQVYRINA
jgi:hypothetical protein